MSFGDFGDDALDNGDGALAALIPDDFADDLDDGYVDLPFEAGSADPQDLEYADLPGVNYDPTQNWRDAQQQAVGRMTGEFAPEGEEATDG